MRRKQTDEPASPVLRFAALEVDLPKRLVTLDGEQIRLTPTEYGLLEALVTNPGKLLTHQWLLRKVWGQGYGTETTYLRTYVRALRKKLGDDAQAPALIVTEPGRGVPLGGRTARADEALVAAVATCEHAAVPAELELPRRVGGGPLKRLFLGRAIASDKAEHQLLPKFLALPVFSSDPLSSNAYATEEMMLVLVAAGAGALTLAPARSRSRSRPCSRSS